MQASKLMLMFCLNGAVAGGAEAGGRGLTPDVWGGPKSDVQGGGLGGPSTVRSKASRVMVTWGLYIWTERMTDTDD